MISSIRNAIIATAAATLLSGCGSSADSKFIQLCNDTNGPAVRINNCSALMLSPERSIWAYQNRAEAYTELKQFDKALADYNEVFRLHESGSKFLDGREHLRALEDRAKVKQKLGDKAGAQADLDKFYELRIGYMAPILNYDMQQASMKEEKGDYDGALALRDFIARYDFKSPLSFYNRGVVYSRKGDFAKAAEDYSKAIALKPDHVKALNNRADAYDRLGQYGKALADANKAIALDPGLAEIYVTRGSIKSHKGDKAGAEADRRKARELGYTGEF